MTGHALDFLLRLGKEQWRGACTCGHLTPTVGDRRTAAQGVDAHRRNQHEEK